MIIICYDGSEDAQAAADLVIRLLHDKPATVLTVWEPDVEALVSSGSGLGSGFGLGHNNRITDTRILYAHPREWAQRTADEGARRMRANGMDVDAFVEACDRSIARTVLAVAKRVNAEAVIVGTRGRGRAKAALLGSVARSLVQDADRAVVVVPSPSQTRRA
jgi:nucleotide-binding universal stress UspA family protein